MTMNENCEQLRSLIKLRYDKEIFFYAMPKTTDSNILLDDEMAMSLLQNKKMRSYFKADDLVIPVFRGTVLDGAVIIKRAEDLSRANCMQLTELVELLITDILSLHSDAEELWQTQDQLEKQLRLTDIYQVESRPKSEGLIH